MHVTLQPFDPSAFEVLAALRRDRALQDMLMAYPEETDASDDMVQAWIERRQEPSAGLFSVIADDGVPQGFAQISDLHRKGAFGYFGIAVMPGGRRRGVGLSALLQLKELAKAHDLGKLLAEVRMDNAPSLAMCASAGFRQVGILQRHYKGIDVCLLEAIL